MDRRKRMTRLEPRGNGEGAPVGHAGQAGHVDRRLEDLVGRDKLSALSGAIAEISVATVLTLFEMERRSGLVLLQAGPRRGQIGVRAGQVVRAVVGGGRPLNGREALFALLDWHEGRFEYRPGEVAGSDQMRVSTSRLLLEAARRTDEQNGWQG